MGVFSKLLAATPYFTNNGAMGGWVYIMTSRANGPLYVGVTSDLPRRAWEHREGAVAGFTKSYRLKRLVFAEYHEDIRQAIQREKNIKHWPRSWKIDLIAHANPHWSDLYEQLIELAHWLVRELRRERFPLRH